jgi:hypothetical protein
MVRSRDSSVGIATGYRLDDPGSIPDSARFIPYLQRPDRLWGPPSLLYNGYLWLFPPGHEADHSTPSSAEVKKGGVIPPLPNVSSWHNA